MPSSRSAPAIATLALLVLAASPLAPVPAWADTPVAYRCADGTRLQATFSPPSNQPGTVTLVTPGRPAISLGQALSADGGRYVSGDTQFWIKGRSATFTTGGRSLSCKAR